MGLEPDFLTQDVVRFPQPKGILRPDESVWGLVNERLQRAVPGARLTRIKQYPSPVGADETARALRQRQHIATGVRGPRMPKK